MQGPSTLSFVSSARRSGHARRANRRVFGWLAARVVLASLFALVLHSTAEASNRITNESHAPGEPRKTWYGLEIGPTFALPLPAASANRDAIGLDVGLNCTAKPTPSLGLGVTAAYHYWPVSDEFKQKFNELLSDETLNTLKLGGGTWGLQVLQLGVHLRATAPSTRAMRPWLLVGGSIYEVNPNTSGYSGDAGFFTVTAPPLKRTQHLGYSVTVGMDMLGNSSVRVGLDATYHDVDCSGTYGEDLKMFTLGVHALFNW